MDGNKTFDISAGIKGLHNKRIRGRGVLALPLVGGYLVLAKVLSTLTIVAKGTCDTQRKVLCSVPAPKFRHFSSIHIKIERVPSSMRF